MHYFFVHRSLQIIASLISRLVDNGCNVMLLQTLSPDLSLNIRFCSVPPERSLTSVSHYMHLFTLVLSVADGWWEKAFFLIHFVAEMHKHIFGGSWTVNCGGQPQIEQWGMWIKAMSGVCLGITAQVCTQTPLLPAPRPSLALHHLASFKWHQVAFLLALFSSLCVTTHWTCLFDFCWAVLGMHGLYVDYTVHTLNTLNTHRHYTHTIHTSSFHLKTSLIYQIADAFHLRAWWNL